jgi:hypothetical protein
MNLMRDSLDLGDAIFIICISRKSSFRVYSDIIFMDKSDENGNETLRYAYQTHKSFCFSLKHLKMLQCNTYSKRSLSYNTSHHACPIKSFKTILLIRAASIFTWSVLGLLEVRRENFCDLLDGALTVRHDHFPPMVKAGS